MIGKMFGVTSALIPGIHNDFIKKVAILIHKGGKGFSLKMTKNWWQKR
jgi:TctA family transporter